MRSRAERFLDSIRRRAPGKERQLYRRIFGLVAGVLLFLMLSIVPAGSGVVQDGPDLAEVLDPPAPVEAAHAPVRVSWDESHRVPILMYHGIGAPAAGLTVAPDAFHKQVDALVDAGYETVPLDTLLLALRGEPVWLPEKSVVLTFDDAYDGVYREAYPVLKSHGFKGTLFVITGLVGKKGYVNWEQVRELAANGWTIGSHTVHHQDLRLLSGKNLEDEIVPSRRVLQENAGQTVLSFCYPAGKYSDLVIQTVKSAGYYGAVTTEPGIAAMRDGSFTLKRVRVDGRDGLDVFKAKLSIP